MVVRRSAAYELKRADREVGRAKAHLATGGAEHDLREGQARLSRALRAQKIARDDLHDAERYLAAASAALPGAGKLTACLFSVLRFEADRFARIVQRITRAIWILSQAPSESTLSQSTGDTRHNSSWHIAELTFGERRLTQIHQICVVLVVLSRMPRQSWIMLESKKTFRNILSVSLYPAHRSLGRLADLLNGQQRITNGYTRLKCLRISQRINWNSFAKSSKTLIDSTGSGTRVRGTWTSLDKRTRREYHNTMTLLRTIKERVIKLSYTVSSTRLTRARNAERANIVISASLDQIQDPESIRHKTVSPRQRPSRSFSARDQRKLMFPVLPDFDSRGSCGTTDRSSRSSSGRNEVSKRFRPLRSGSKGTRRAPAGQASRRGSPCSFAPVQPRRGSTTGGRRSGRLECSRCSRRRATST